jgi:2-dehydropantoate 2-reductase
MACLFAARLAEVGFDIGMLGHWPDGLRALQTQGVRLMTAENPDSFPVTASADPNTFIGAQTVIVLNKSWQTGQIAAELGQCLHKAGRVLTLQNGLGNREQLVEVLQADRVELGSTTYGATLAGPGQVRPGGQGMISLPASDAGSHFAAILSRAGFSLEQVTDTDSLIWGKLVINAAINPLTALLKIPNGALLEDPKTRQKMAALATETAHVAAALGIDLPFSDPAQAAVDVARKTAANYSSMYQDILRGAPTEIDAICGAIVQAAESVGAAAPLNREMWRRLRRSNEG